MSEQDWGKLIGPPGPQGPPGPKGDPGVVTATSGVIATQTAQAPSGQSGFSSGTQQNVTKLGIQGPGRNFGNAGGWSGGKSEYTEFTAAQRGIHQLKSFIFNKHAVGDTAGIYGYVFSDGGVHGQSDEGVTAATLELSENAGYFHGVIASTTGIGDTAPKLAFTSGNAWTTDGAFLLNISKGTIAGNMLSASQPLVLNGAQTFLNYLPVTQGSLPISTAVGIGTAAIPVNQFTADSPQTQSVTVKLVDATKPFTVGSYVSIAGNWFPEQAKLLAVVTNPDGTQTLTMNLRNPNGSFIVFQGGVAGQYISFDANLALSGMRSSYFAFGSLTGSDLIYGLQCGGSVESTLPMTGNEAAKADGGPNSGFHLFPGAEVVANADQGFNCTLEQNSVAWTAADVVENPHYPVFGGSALFVTKYQITPSSPSAGSIGFQLQVGGPGWGGGNVAAMRIRNINPASMYTGGGGPIQATNAVEVLGPHHSIIYADTGPQGDGAGLFIQNIDTTRPCLVITLNNVAGGNVWFNPATGGWRFDGPIDAPGFTKNGVPI